MWQEANSHDCETKIVRIGMPREYPIFPCFPPPAVPTKPNIVCREPGATGRPAGWNEPKIARIVSNSAIRPDVPVAQATAALADAIFTDLLAEHTGAGGVGYDTARTGIDLQNLCGGIDLDANGNQVALRGRPRIG